MKLLKNNKTLAVISALFAAFLFGICTPFAKILTRDIPSVELGGCCI